MQNTSTDNKIMQCSLSRYICKVQKATPSRAYELKYDNPIVLTWKNLKKKLEWTWDVYMGLVTEHGLQSSCLETIFCHIWWMKILSKSWKHAALVELVLSFSSFQLSFVPFSACLESYPLMTISSFPISSVSNTSIIRKEN